VDGLAGVRRGWRVLNNAAEGVVFREVMY
jgi:hypothetical protein